MESNTSRLYFPLLFGKKFKRFEEDVINAALNYGYAILRSIIKQQIVLKGLQPSLGIWHKSQFNNFNLSDDIIEVYRPIVDIAVYGLFQETKEFTSIERNKLKKIIFTSIIFGNEEIYFRQSVVRYIDEIINFMNLSSESLIIPIINEG